jgi:hypothetical protein
VLTAHEMFTAPLAPTEFLEGDWIALDAALRRVVANCPT